MNWEATDERLNNVRQQSHILLGGQLTDFARELMERSLGELRAGLDAVLADPQPGDERERQRLLIRGHVHFVARNPAVVRLMHEEAKRLSDADPAEPAVIDAHARAVEHLFLDFSHEENPR